MTMVNIIIKGKTDIGKTRSEQEANLRKEGWGGTMTDEQLDKCKYLEKKIKEITGAEKIHPKQHHVDAVK
jgi:hypothetical protein